MENVISIKIFDKVLFGKSAEKYCALDIPSKIEWIKANTNQQDEVLIRKFLNLSPKPYNGGCGCGMVKTIEENVTERVPTPDSEADTANIAELSPDGIDGSPSGDSKPESPRVNKGGATKRKADRDL